MSEEYKCPKCGESEHYYPNAIPTGALTAEGLVELKIGEGGHCLHCGHEAPENETERARGWLVAAIKMVCSR